MKIALIIVDMLNDFVTGSLACDRGKAIVPNLAKLIKAARGNGVYVIYSNDSHIKDIDKELILWGEHAIRGTAGAEIIPELAAESSDFIVPKRRYSGFFQTDLQLLLSELKVNTVVLTGLHAHMCVRHTAADAFNFGYEIIVPKDATDSFTEEDYVIGIKYLREVYGAEITDVESLIAKWK
ncbi:MAG: cysteine hydrolase [Deferribacteraceae bacterium]|jgi:nicotinamidase-related amidase|nr:cysteine hydrolase [Deferribacteraceae bacterium]